MVKATRKRRGFLRRSLRKRSLRKRSLRLRSKRGGNLGRIPPAATVSIQQDPYSARVLVDTETAEDMLEARGPYLLSESVTLY